MGENVTCVQEKLYRFNAELKNNLEYMERDDDEEGYKMLDDLDASIAERAAKSQKIHFEAFEMTITLYKSGWDIRLKQLRWKLVSAVSGPDVMTDHLKDFLARVGEEANSEGQVETGQQMSPR